MLDNLLPCIRKGAIDHDENLFVALAECVFKAQIEPV